MEVRQDHEKKIIEVWLTKAEKADEAMQCRLRPMYARWKRQKYLVAVYCSGAQDLQEQTACLLLHNRNVFAAQAAEQEQAQRNQQPRLFSHITFPTKFIALEDELIIYWYILC